MALDSNDLALIKSMNGGMTPYEQIKTQHMQAKGHTSGIAVTGLVTGIVGTVAGITAWIFNPLYSNAKAAHAREAAQSAKEIAAAQYAAALQLMTSQNQETKATLDRILRSFEIEHQERVQGDITLNATINDTVSGQQQGTQTQSVAQEVTQQVMTGLMTGRYSENPQRVALYQDAKPCACPAGGCGCGM